MELARGSYLSQRYQILDCINDRATPPTYLAADKINQSGMGSLQVLVSLKVYDKLTSAISPLRREIEVLSNVKSDHVLKTFEIIEEKSLSAISSENIAGDLLFRRMRRVLLNSSEITEILLQLAKGLEALHAKGVFLGNLDENAIYITADGKVKIDPLAKNPSASNDALEDIKALGRLGLTMCEGLHFVPELKNADRLSKSWSIKTNHSEELLSLLHSMSGDNVGRIRFNSATLARRAFEKIAGMQRFELSPHLLQIVFSGTQLVILTVTIISLIFALLGYLAMLTVR